jgi:hypothetical protein
VAPINQSLIYTILKSQGSEIAAALPRFFRSKPCLARPIAHGHRLPKDFSSMTTGLSSVLDWVRRGEKVTAKVLAREFMSLSHRVILVVNLYRFVKRATTPKDDLGLAARG